MAEVNVAPGITIPDAAIAFSASRASGPGGQNVNKVASKVELRVDTKLIQGLTMGARSRLQALAGKRWLEGGTLLITSSETRNQVDNRVLAETKLVELIKEAIIIPKARRATKPTRGSQERRVTSKKERSQVKQNRGRYRGDE